MPKAQRNKMLPFWSVMLVAGIQISFSTAFAQSEPQCNLGHDYCAARPDDLKNAEGKVKSYGIAEAVAAKIEDLMKSEATQNRELKVVLLSRMGSDLGGLHPLLEKDSRGNFLETDQILENLKLLSEQDRSGREGHSTNLAPITSSALYESYDKKRNVKYSHMGIAVKMDTYKVAKDGTRTLETDLEAGRWTVFQLLYTCDQQHKSYIWQGTTFQFYDDNMHDFQGQIIVPAQQIQDNLFALLNSKDKDWTVFKSPHYNAAALPYELDEQNSNQFVLELIAAAERPSGEIRSREQAQALLKQTGYYPTRLTATGLTALGTNPLGAKLLAKFMPTVCFKNQPNITTYNVGDVITALSVQEYMQRQGLVASTRDGGEQIYEAVMNRREQKSTDKFTEQQWKDGVNLSAEADGN